MYGLTRGTMTLIGAAAAGLLLWFATQVDADTVSGYWSAIGLLAAAGLAIAFSQLLGGWTKWGWPRISGSVFLLGFVPALVAGGLVILHAQPDDGAFGTGWAGDLGAGGLADDLTAMLPAIAFALGLIFGLTFDTTGPVVRELEDEAAQPEYIGPIPISQLPEDEPVRAERQASPRDASIDRDRDGVPDREEALVGARRDRDYETGTPVAPQPTEDEPQPRRFFGRWR